MKLKETYRERLRQTEAELAVVNKRILSVSMFRVLLFVVACASVVLFWDSRIWVLMLVLACTVFPFLILVKVHNRFFARKQWLEIRADLIRKELKGLDNDYSGFDGGEEFIDPDHFYSYDLDLFGNRSLFQATNRTCTKAGKQLLAGWMQYHLRDKEEIIRRQASVQDLAGRVDFRECFCITGLMAKDRQGDEKEISQWGESESRLLKLKWVRPLLWGVPAVNALLLVAGLAGFLPLSAFGLSFGFFVILSFGVVKRVTVLQEEYGAKLKILGTYARLISLIQKEEWKASGLRTLSEQLNIDGKSPAEALHLLTRELDRLDLRNNQLLYVVLEGSVFFQLYQMVRIERWRERYGCYLKGWIETVARMDAFCSLAAFAYNHPDYSYPEIADEPFCFQARAMGHPLMPAGQCVTNDAEIPSRPFFLIITGANMAGKSTYLRTIGVNFLLACIGAPVCCRHLRLYPAQLITSLRTSDSLSDNESYFFAELKRLKRIIDLLNQGEQLFIILDEILKGTNSADKQLGSFNLIRQFVRLEANGIIATHDLLLGDLIKRFPDEIRNYCFEADISGDELSFSYRIREGVARNMNACFLMKKMGIDFSD